MGKTFSILIRCIILLGLLSAISIISPSHSALADNSIATQPQINGIFNADIIYPSQTSRLTIFVYNPNSSPLSDVSWLDTLPDDLSLTQTPNAVISGCGSSYDLTAEPGTNTITLIGADAAGTTNSNQPGICSVTVSVTSASEGNHTNNIDKTDTTHNYAVINGAPIYYEYDAAITLLVLPMEDLTLTKKFTPSVIMAGQTSQLEIDITNNDSHVDLSNLSLVDIFPDGLTVYNTSTSSSGCGSNVIFQGSNDSPPVSSINWSSLTSGQSEIKISGATVKTGATCKLIVTVVAGKDGLFENIIPQDTLENDQNLTNPKDVSSILKVINLEISKSFGYSSFINSTFGGTTPLTITLKNPNLEDDLSQVTLIDTLPTSPGEMTAVAGTYAVAGTGCSGTVDAPSGSPTIGLSDGVIPKGGTCTITVNVTASTAGSYTNTLHCSDISFISGSGSEAINASCQDATASVTVYDEYEGLEVTKNYSIKDIIPGGKTILSIRVISPPDIGLSEFSLTDNLPDNVRVASPPHSSLSGCTGTFSPSAGATSLVFSNGVIPQGSTCLLKVDVTSTEEGLHTNTITSSDISNKENRNLINNAEASFTVRDISVSKGFSNAMVGNNGKTRLTITLTNHLSDNPLTDVAFQDPLPATDDSNGIFFAPEPDPENTCGGSLQIDTANQKIVFSNGSIPASSSCDISVSVAGRSSDSPPSGSFNNVLAIGDVTGKVNGGDTISNQKSSSATLKIGVPDFRINKKYDPILVTGDSASTMTISLENLGSDALTGIDFTDTLPEHQLLADPPLPGVGTCGGTITPAEDRKSFHFSGGSLPAKGSCKLTIKAMMDITGNTINTIQVNSVSTDQGATNTQKTSATLTNLSGISVVKLFAPGTVSPGATTRLTITLSKVGIGIGLTGLEVTDNLPAGLEIASGNVPTSTNTCGGTLSAVPGATQIKLTGGVMDINTPTCLIAVSIATPTKDASDPMPSYTNCISANTVKTNEGYTNIMDGCDTLDSIFDPPTGYKVFSGTGTPQLEWKMVWINNSNYNGINARISDMIPKGTTYIPNSISCEARGISTTTTCTFDEVNQQVFWQGNIGPDHGATNETDAMNEVVIVFRVNIPRSLDKVINQATALTDTNDDGDFTDETDSTSSSSSNLSTWVRGGSLPETGFAPGISTIPNPQSIEKAYSSFGDVRLEIPAIHTDLSVVGVPEINQTWDVSWLGNNAGWLNGTAFPGWNGNAVLTAHVVDSNGKPGPFINLRELRYGNRVIIHSSGKRLTYEVRSLDVVGAKDISSMLKHEDLPWLTLMTCHNFDEQTKHYTNRILARAVLINVEDEK